MRIDVYTPLILSLVLAAATPLVIRRCAPSSAARALTIAAAATATSFLWTLALLVATLYDDVPVITAHARHSGIPIPEPVPDFIGIAAIAGLLICVWRLYRVLAAHRSSRTALRRLAASHAGDTEMIVAHSAEAVAFTIPGKPGRILATTAMLRRLTAADRRVLLAHERAHLRHHHHRMRLVADMAAAVNPFLIPVRESVGYLLERWADEDAARATGDRGSAAHALARAALPSTAPTVQPLLQFTDRAVTRRVSALHHAPTTTRGLAGLLLAFAAIPVIATADATQDFLLLIPHHLLG